MTTTILSGILLMCVASTGAQETPPSSSETVILSYPKLLEWVVDLQRLTQPPVPGMTCKQFSSYDRRSTIDPQTGEKSHWKANNDAGQFIRKDADGYVMAEMEGPGCIFRIWSANPKGELLFFIDDRKEPVWRIDFVSLIEGKALPFISPYVGYHGRGANCFIPIPYQRNCRVVATEPGFYYHVNYVTFPKNYQVPWFTLDMDSTTKADVVMIGDLLGNFESLHQEAGLWSNRENGKTTIRTGEKKKTVLKGPGTIQSFRLKVSHGKNSIDDILRKTLIRITWDDDKTPSVETPLGDFFGTAPGFHPYKSVPMGVDGDWFYCNWVMPFEKATIEFESVGAPESTIEWKIGWNKKDHQSVDQMLRFNARWRSETPAKVFDWPILECTGPGWFVGCMLSIWNPVPGWWGEGDEKVYVDGEVFPSWFGTGSEDYFGDAWGHRVFEHGLHACPRRDQSNYGLYTCVNRWHLSDAIPFQDTFRMTIENYDDNKDYTAVAYWYAAKGTSNFFKPIRTEQLMVRPPQQVGFKAFDDAIEFTEMKIVDKPDYSLAPQGTYKFMSKASHLFGRPKQAGATAKLTFTVPAAGEYVLIAHLTKSFDYGTYDLLLDGETVIENFDGYSPRVVPSGPIEIGKRAISKGDHTIAVKVTGKNEKSKGYYFGLDCIQLKKVKEKKTG